MLLFSHSKLRLKGTKVYACSLQTFIYIHTYRFSKQF